MALCRSADSRDGEVLYGIRRGNDGRHRTGHGRQPWDSQELWVELEKQDTHSARTETDALNSTGNCCAEKCSGGFHEITQSLLQLQTWVSTKRSPINSFFVFTNFNISSVFGIKDTFYYAILRDSIRRHPGLEL